MMTEEGGDDRRQKHLGDRFLLAWGCACVEEADVLIINQ